MQQTLLARKYLYESSEILDGNNLSVINLSGFRNGGDALDPVESLLHTLLVCSEDVDSSDAGAVVLLLLGDGNGGSGFLLDLLDNLSALADNGTDELSRDSDLDDTRSVRLEFRTRSVESLHHLAHNVLAGLVSLCKSLGHNLFREAIALDIHLGCSDTVLGSRYLEVHIAEMILIAENIGKDCIFAVLLDESHRNTCNRLLDLDTGVHKCQTAGANACH